MKFFDSNGLFASPVPGGDASLRRAAVRGAGSTIASGALGLGIQIIATVTLGRLLTPRDFGLVAMVWTFSYLLSNGPANGLIDALIQRKEVTHTLASTLFWLNLALMILLTIGFAASGPLLKRFYGEPLVVPITVVMSATVILTGAPVIHSALLRKAMRFTALAKNTIIARAAGVTTSIGFALAGWRYWALVMGVCATAISTGIGILILCPWIPGRPQRRCGVASVSRFAAHITGRYAFNYFASNSDNVLVGWRFGAHALGFYKKAYDLFVLPASQLVAATSNVAVSALSRVRGDSLQFRRYLLGSIAVMSLVGMGLAGDLTLIGKDLIRVLLGPKWGQTGVIFTYFAPGIGMMIVYYIHGWIHVAIGRADRWFRWGVVEWTVTFSLFLLGLRWGPEGIAMAWCASFWILTIPAMSYAGKPIDLRGREVAAIMWRYVAASLCAGLAVYFIVMRIPMVHRLAGTGGSAIRIVVVTVTFAVLYMALIVVFHGGTEPLGRIRKLTRELTSRSKIEPVPAQTEVAEGKA